MAAKSNFKEFLKNNVVDSSAMIVESTPIFAAVEVYLSKLSVESSAYARLLGAGIAFGGIGRLYGWGRDLSTKILKVTEKTSEALKVVHDFAYTAAFNIVITPPMYTVSEFLSGNDLSLENILTASVTASIFGAANGIPMGYALDVYRDLTGQQECTRSSYPDFIKRQSPNVKKGLVAALVLGSLGTTGAIYYDASVPEKVIEREVIPEQKIVETDYVWN